MRQTEPMTQPEPAVIDLTEARQQRQRGQEAALLALFSGVLGKPLVRRDLPPRQQLEREMKAAHRQELRKERIATATGTTL